jgi:hypothetical protein
MTLVSLGKQMEAKTCTLNEVVELLKTVVDEIGQTDGQSEVRGIYSH